eukprot:362713-Chlamydomonas_euryale.AAC.1
MSTGVAVAAAAELAPPTADIKAALSDAKPPRPAKVDTDAALLPNGASGVERAVGRSGSVTTAVHAPRKSRSGGVHADDSSMGRLAAVTTAVEQPGGARQGGGTPSATDAQPGLQAAAAAAPPQPMNNRSVTTGPPSAVPAANGQAPG